MVSSRSFLIVDTYYEPFLDHFYRRDPGLSRQSYTSQERKLLDQAFGTADFYSHNLRLLGHEARELIANAIPLQLAWTRAHSRKLWSIYPVYKAMNKVDHWLGEVVLAQVRHFAPDVVLFQDLYWTPPSLVSSIRGQARLVVAQTASPLRNVDLSPYDVVVSSFPHYVDRFRRAGISSEYVKLAFDERILERVSPARPKHDASFVGSYSADHSRGNQILEEVARTIDLHIWGHAIETLPARSHLRSSFRGEAWAIDMYQILARSRTTINRHIDVAEDYANNMRLFEATGVGTCLVTDEKSNLGDLFEADVEVVSYASAAECVEKIRYLLDNERERRSIATNGQRRTLTEHNYMIRMQELSEIVEKYI